LVRAASQPTSSCKRAQQSPADPEPPPCNTIPRRNLTGKNGSPSTRRNACSSIEAYHRRARIRLPNEKVHAVIHAIVENQIALGDELPV